MSTFPEYLKSYLCDCNCGWTVEAENPEKCWQCGSDGPHRVMATSRTTCKFLKIKSSDEDYLFSPASGLLENEDGLLGMA